MPRGPEFIAGLEASPEQQELFIKAMELARSTSLKTKRSAHADALASGVQSADAAVRETQFVRVLENLDAAHIQTLRLLGQRRGFDEMPRPAGTISALHYETHDVAKLSPNAFGPVDQLLAVLAAQGLAEVGDFDSLRPIKGIWCITGYGIEVLARLMREHESEASGVPDS